MIDAHPAVTSRHALIILLGVLMCAATAPSQPRKKSTETLRSTAARLAKELTIIDTHIDLPWRLLKSRSDVSVRTPTGDFDYPRARAGGLNVPFMSIYVPSEHDGKPSAEVVAGKLIDIVDGLIRRWPDKFSLVRSVEEIRRHGKTGVLSLAMGMENGSGIGEDLSRLQYFHDRGIRYITLAHAKSNLIADAAYDKKRPWMGLSPFGRKFVAEMNRVGIMVDVSHVSDSAARQAILLSRAPVIASHSACRAFTPGWERNISDDLIRLIAEHGGTVQIPFASSFLVDSIRVKVDGLWSAVSAYAKKHHLASGDAKVVRYAREYRKSRGIPYAGVSDVARHIDHVVQLAGIDHVGLGSDFDGVGDDLPVGLKDVSGYPALIEELLRRGYTEEQIQKVCSGNLLRVWSAVEQVSREMKQPK